MSLLAGHASRSFVRISTLMPNQFARIASFTTLTHRSTTASTAVRIPILSTAIIHRSASPTSLPPIRHFGILDFLKGKSNDTQKVALDPEIRAQLANPSFHDAILNECVRNPATRAQLLNPMLIELLTKPGAAQQIVSMMSMFSSQLASQMAREFKSKADLSAGLPEGLKKAMTDEQILQSVFKDEELMQPIIQKLVDTVQREVEKDKRRKV